MLQAEHEDSAGVKMLTQTIINITVVDVNDNCPLFVNTPYIAAVSADAEKHVPFIRVRRTAACVYCLAYSNIVLHTPLHITQSIDKHHSSLADITSVRLHINVNVTTKPHVTRKVGKFTLQISRVG